GRAVQDRPVPDGHLQHEHDGQPDDAPGGGERRPGAHRADPSRDRYDAMTPAPGPVLAADLGGTKITAGAVLGDGEVLAARTIPTGAMRGPEAILADLHQALRASRTEALAAGAGEPVAVGIGTAGVVDPARGMITAATGAIPGWVGT